MKPTTILLCTALLTGPLTAQNDEAAPPPGLEDAVVSLIMEANQSVTLGEVLQEVSSQLPTAPSIIFKPGAEGIPVPTMSISQVRFGDFLKALEELAEVRFKIMNPDPKQGESSLLIVDANPRQLALLGGGFAGGAAGTDDFGAAEQSILGSHPGAESRAGGFDAGSGLLHSRQTEFGTSPPQTRGPRAVPSPRVNSATWPSPYQPSRATITRTYAIGPLVDGMDSEHPFAQIIEAINLVWSTSGVKMPRGEDAARVAMHEPSRLLIIKATGELQSLASEVITNLTNEHEERLRLRNAKESTNALLKEHQRELDHLKQLQDVSTERLKSSYKAEVDKLRAALQQLETQNRLLQTQLRAGGGG